MRQKSKWYLYVFFVMYLLAAFAQAVEFMSGGSEMNLFYRILIAYDPAYILVYLRNAASVLLNLAAVIPFWLYLRRAPLLSARFWRVLFVFRLAFDLTGRIYEVNFLKALFHQDSHLALDVLTLIILFILPSYVALYKYAFTGAVFSSPAPFRDAPAARTHRQ